MADISQPLTSTWRAPQAQAARTIGNAGLPLFVAVFLVGLLIPLIINVGGMRLSIYRIVLLLMFVPALVRLLSGAAGPLRTPDFAVLVICIWSNLSLLVVQGPLIETIGILTVETMGAYLIGRAYIRTPEAFLATCRMLLALALLVFPFALAETATGTRFILNIFDMVGRTYPDVPKDPRMGLNRVQGPFAHQIHFGVFFGVLIGITFYVVGYGKSFLGQSWRTLVVAITGALALSSGPLSALVAQLYMGFWDWGLRRIKIRWYILAGLTVFAYVTIDLLSNRNPFQIFISYMAFNSHTAYNRILIWEFGTASIFNNPVWGIGLTDNWERPFWMSPSADMFWILPAMRHGIVVWIGWFVLFFSISLPLMFRSFKPLMHNYRMGFLVSLSGFFMAGWTVHYWDAVFVFFLFFLGAGVWMIDYREDDNDADDTPLQADPARTPYSRFPTIQKRPIIRQNLRK